VAASVRPATPERPSGDEELAECVRTLRALVDVVGSVQHVLDRLGRQAPVRASAVKKRQRRKTARGKKRKAKK
jgi:hypothetical protein